jgi:hypothetical protein
MSVEQTVSARVSSASQSPQARGRVAVEALNGALADAEVLLAYAAEAGIDVDPDAAQRVVAALGHPQPWAADDAGRVIAAMAKIAAAVHPVTAESLRASCSTAPKEILAYRIWALLLALAIVPLSVVSFVTSGLSSSISADITSANQLTVSLHADLDAPAGSSTSPVAPSSTLTDLQEFTTLIRTVKNHSVMLNNFLWWAGVAVPNSLGGFKSSQLELSASLGPKVPALQKELNAKTLVYQSVRSYAKDVQGNNLLVYGAVTAVVLPILYALLGACAYLLRLFADEMSKNTFSSSSYSISARFFVALIGGIIVGLFRDYTSAASLPPLALAFLVGYASDAFFSFLESLTSALQSRTGTARGAASAK